MFLNPGRVLGSSFCAKDNHLCSGNTPHQKNAMVVSSAGKVMASVLLDAKSIVFINYFQTCHTINEEYYADLLRQLRTGIKTKRKTFENKYRLNELYIG